MDPRKGWAALFCVALALFGAFSGFRWLTVLALGLWIAAMIYFGRGERHPPRRIDPDQENF